MFNRAGLDLMDLKTYKSVSNVIKSRINEMRKQRNDIIKKERNENNNIKTSVKYKNYMSKGVVSRLCNSKLKPFHKTKTIIKNNNRRHSVQYKKYTSKEVVSRLYPFHKTKTIIKNQSCKNLETFKKQKNVRKSLNYT